MMNNTPQQPQEIPDYFREYAWNWFAYHAGQRLTGFRFFLVVLGAFILSFYNSLTGHHYKLAIVIAGLGAFVSLAFLMLEFRNENLVEAGREALKTIEVSNDFPYLDSTLKLISNDRNRCVLLSHLFWFRTMYIVSILFFIIGAIIAAKFPDLLIS